VDAQEVLSRLRRYCTSIIEEKTTEIGLILVKKSDADIHVCEGEVRAYKDMMYRIGYLDGKLRGGIPPTHPLTDGDMD